MMEKLGFVVFLLCLLSGLMACGAVIWIACNFHKLMKVLANAAIDVQTEGPTQIDQLLEYIALTERVRCSMAGPDELRELYLALPHSLRGQVELRIAKDIAELVGGVV